MRLLHRGGRGLLKQIKNIMRGEDNFITVLSCSIWNKEKSEEIEEVIKNNLDWDYVLRKSRKEGVSSLIYYCLKKFELQKYLPSEVLKNFEEIYYQNSVRNIFMVRETGKVLESFKKEGIESIILKGVFLAEKIYRNIALREMTDVDILIRRKDVKKANRILNSLGYPTPKYYEDLLKISSSLNTLMYKGNIRIHLHWHLINSTWPLNFLVEEISIERIFEYAKPIKVDTLDTLTLSNEHLLIYLCYHLFNHSFDRLLLLVDILGLLNSYSIDWNFVIEEAERFKLSFILYYVLSFISQKKEEKVPYLERLKPSKSYLKKLPPSSFTSYFIYLLLQKGFKKKIKFLINTIFPSPCVVAHSFSISPKEVTRAHYFFRLIKPFLKFF